LDATNDKHRFVLDSGTLAVSDERYWPVYGGRSLQVWQPDTGKYYASAHAAKIRAHLFNKRKNQHRHIRSAFREFPTEVILDRNSLPCLRPRIAYRDVTNRMDARTVYVALVPGRVVLNNKAPYLLRIRGEERDEAYLLGVLSSMILDWYARTTVNLALSIAILNSFPIPDVDVDEDPLGRRVVEIAGRLAAIDERYAEWAEAVGVEVGSANDDPIKTELIYELDACVALLYGLDEDDLAVIYDTFHATTDYSERHASVLKHFRRWRDNPEIGTADDTGSVEPEGPAAGIPDSSETAKPEDTE